LLLQGLLYALQLRVRVVEQQQRQQMNVVREYWFRSSSAALTPGKTARPEVVFTGDRGRFQGLSLMPLLGDPGVPILIEWRLEAVAGGMALHYRQGGDPRGWRITRWETPTAGFRYRDEAGQWLDRWPPATITRSAADPAVLQLPTGIRLDVTEAAVSLVWLSPITGRREPKMDLQEWLLTPDLPPDL
jgi:hypothetical protein